MYVCMYVCMYMNVHVTETTTVHFNKTVMYTSYRIQKFLQSGATVACMRGTCYFVSAVNFV